MPSPRSPELPRGSEREMCRLIEFDKAMVHHKGRLECLEGKSYYGYVYSELAPSKPRCFIFWKDQNAKEKGKHQLWDIMMATSMKDGGIPQPDLSVHTMSADGNGLFVDDSDRFYHTAWISTHLATSYQAGAATPLAR